MACAAKAKYSYPGKGALIVVLRLRIVIMSERMEMLFCKPLNWLCNNNSEVGLGQISAHYFKFTSSDAMARNPIVACVSAQNSSVMELKILQEKSQPHCGRVHLCKFLS